MLALLVIIALLLTVILIYVVWIGVTITNNQVAIAHGLRLQNSYLEKIATRRE